VRANPEGRDELSERVQRALSLATKKEAEHVSTDGFTLKLNGFDMFHVRHKPSIRRKIGFTGKTIHTKMLRKVMFISLGKLRRQERVD
jgi:nucleoid DNA-binding protein